MIGYYLPQVPFAEAPAHAATSRLCTMGKWNCLDDQAGGSIVYQVGWTKGTARAIRKTDEGWGYAPNPILPKIETLLRNDRPDSEAITIADGTVLHLPLVKRSPRRAMFRPGGGEYGQHTKQWALMAMHLLGECKIVPSGSGSRIQFDCSEQAMMSALYACLVQCYFLTHELATDILCLTNMDMCAAMYAVWGYSPKQSAGDGGNSPSSPAESATVSPSPPANMSA